MTSRLIACALSACLAFALGLFLGKWSKVSRRRKLLFAVLFAAEVGSLFFVYGLDMRVVPFLGMASFLAGACFKEQAGGGPKEFAFAALLWWAASVLLTGDTMKEWGMSWAAGLIGGAVLGAAALLISFLAKRYWKRHKQTGVFFTKTDCLLLALPGLYFGIVIGSLGFLIELFLAIGIGNIRTDKKMPAATAAAVACWFCALFGAGFIRWYFRLF